MAAVTRWVSYPVGGTGSTSVGGATMSGVGIRGYSIGDTPSDDTFNIGATTNRLYVNMDGDGDSNTFITLASGTGLES